MLKRLYVHNYKCLVNFEINFDQDISLFLGANGSGKSTVFEVLTKLRRLIVDEDKVTNIFTQNDTNKEIGISEPIHFELEIEIHNHIYKYNLDISSFFIHIQNETLYRDDKIFIKSKNKETVLSYYDNQKIFFDEERSVISRHERGFLELFKELFIARINPYAMFSTFEKSNMSIKSNFSNYAEWFAYLNESCRKEVFLLEKNLADVLSKFEGFHIQQAGLSKVLAFRFSVSDKNYYFEELSEGQKVLISLYTLIYCTPDNSIICIDEPENFLALPEIQPWLNALRDQCSERNLQVLLISHHPSLINFLTANSGYWFSREDNHTRIQRITKQNEGGLSFAQLIELGWIYEG